MSKHKNQARRDKARQIKEADRRLIGLSHERRELLKILFNAPLRKLDQPYQRGWVRYFILKEEASRRVDVARLKALLEYLQCIQYSDNIHFLYRPHGKSKRLRPANHELNTIRIHTGIKIPEELLSYLVLQNRQPIGNKSRLRELLLSRYGGAIKARYPHYFVRRLEPHMITHTKVALPEVEKRLAEVESIIFHPKNSGRLDTLQQSRPSSWKMFPENMERHRIKRATMKETQSALLEYHMEQSSITQEGVLSPPSLFLFYLIMRLHRK